jgi:hypothetical protein
VRVPGWCRCCHRIRVVRVELWTRPNVAVGVCWECEEAEDNWRGLRVDPDLRLELRVDPNLRLRAEDDE